jgi:hypothetical protein
VSAPVDMARLRGLKLTPFEVQFLKFVVGHKDSEIALDWSKYRADAFTQTTALVTKGLLVERVDPVLGLRLAATELGKSIAADLAVLQQQAEAAQPTPLDVIPEAKPSSSNN